MSLNYAYFKLRPSPRDLVPPTIQYPWNVGAILSYNRTSTELMTTHNIQFEKLKSEDEALEESPTERTRSQMRVSKNGIPSHKNHTIFIADSISQELDDNDVNPKEVVIGAFIKKGVEVAKAKRKFENVSCRWKKDQYSTNRIHTDPGKIVLVSI